MSNEGESYSGWPSIPDLNKDQALSRAALVYEKPEPELYRQDDNYSLESQRRSEQEAIEAEYRRREQERLEEAERRAQERRSAAIRAHLLPYFQAEYARRKQFEDYVDRYGRIFMLDWIERTGQPPLRTRTTPTKQKPTVLRFLWKGICTLLLTLVRLAVVAAIIYIIITFLLPFLYDWVTKYALG